MPSDASGRGTWTVHLTSHAARDLAHFHDQDPALHRLLTEELKHLAVNPFPAPLKGKKLRGLNGIFWRLRARAYRVLYRPVEPRTLLLLRVISRRELERALKTL